MLKVADSKKEAVVEQEIVPGFHGYIDVRYVDGQQWQLLNEYVYCSPILQTCVRAPKDFKTNFASIPRPFWLLLSPTSPHIAAIAVIHDMLYALTDFNVTRKEADQVMREGMKLLGATWIQHTFVYYALRAFGSNFTPRQIPV